MTRLIAKNHDIMSVLIIFSCLAVVLGNNSVTLDDHCKDRRYVNSLNTTFMQFTKENVDQEYAVEGDFKSLHCCAKGYRSIEWLKDGKRYPWSQEETSSLILYPEAANQTIYARKASKIDEGRYTCVLRNATHKMEHHIELKVKSSSPDIPLATFRPVDQFANVDGSARFYCEAFVGKKVLPDIAISIRWYHSQEGDENIQAVATESNETENDAKSSSTSNSSVEEVVYREDEQIIGSYLKINRVTPAHFGRYLCRVEMGNSRKHRLEMSAELINALPIEANARSLLTNSIILGTCAAITATITFFLLLRCVQTWWLRRMGLVHTKQETEEMKTRQLSTLQFQQQTSKQKSDSVRIQISNS